MRLLAGDAQAACVPSLSLHLSFTRMHGKGARAALSITAGTRYARLYVFKLKLTKIKEVIQGLRCPRRISHSQQAYADSGYSNSTEISQKVLLVIPSPE